MTAPLSRRPRTVVADPPWPFQWQGGRGGRRANATKLGYETMTYEEIADLDVGSLADDEATLLMWVTQDALHSGQARAVALAWGFPIRCGEFIWHKPNFGAGHLPRIGHETCVIYRRKAGGSMRSDGPRDVHSVQRWAQTYGRGNGGKTHSAKPEGFYDEVERGFHGPYLELFARRARLGDWHYWGNESFGTVQMEAA